MCIFNKKDFFFRMKITLSFKIIMKRKTGRFTKFGRTIHPKNVIVPLLNAYCKNLEKLVQWIEDKVQGGVGLFLQKKTWV